ncbi:MAG: AmmeMemoRadiSam system protein B [Victivallales bacterium]|jgi:AmmeMemoRadiSam system protein B|nr:AmmeMemoRadiSam system protein B [Victivallales bacterium]
MPIRDQQTVRLSAVAGTFFEGDALALRRRLAETESKLSSISSNAEDVKGIIVPHAGYIFSLQTAMAAFAPLKQRSISQVILLGTSHYVGFRGIALSNYTVWRTPFGDLSTALKLIDELKKSQNPLVTFRDDAHEHEHSIEVQLPLIQYFFDNPEILPITVGSLSMQDVNSLAEIVATLDAPGTLWVISSDFTHYGTRFRYTPFTENVAEQLKAQDHTAAKLICQRNLSGFAEFLAQTGATICGTNPIALWLGILDRLDPEQTITGTIVAESNSGELTGDYSNAVGYEAISF